MRMIERIGLALVLAAVAVSSWAQSDDEKAIRANVAALVEAYNRHDAAAVAKFFSPDAVFIDEEENTTEGRAEIQQYFTELFKETPKVRMEDTIGSIWMMSPTRALEVGTIRIKRGEGAPAVETGYRVIHEKRKGQWLMTSAADLSKEVWEGESHLKMFEPFIGEWVDESPTAVVKTAYRWSESRRYLLSDFVIQMQGRPARQGTQRIGWDPVRQTIRSWSFDVDGGFSEGTWAHSEGGWLVKVAGVTSNGKPFTFTQSIRFETKDRVVVELRDRTAGDETIPDTEPITIVRKPPMPGK